MKTSNKKCWIVAFDNDSFNFSPSLELISKVKNHNKKMRIKKSSDTYKMYRTKKYVEKLCDELNSL